MFRTRWLRSIRMRSTISPWTARRALPRRRRPFVEALEDRTLLSFAAPVAYTAGGTATSIPEVVTVGDFNSDGRPDVASGNFNAANLSVFFGNGDGTLQVPQNYPLGYGAGSIAAADFNGDGPLDLVVGNAGGSTVTVLLNTGAGVFQALPHFTSPGSGIHSIVVREFNGDGCLDLAMTMYGIAYVNVHLGNGDGSFQAARQFACDYSPYHVAAADLNGDDLLDLAVANQSGRVNVLLGNGDGTFQPRQPYTVGGGGSTLTVTIGDFNGDGRPDLAATVFGPSPAYNGAVSVLRGNGDGTFGPSQHFAAGRGTTGLTTADFNGDSQLDLVTTDALGNTVSLLLGDGDGTFQPRQLFSIDSRQLYPTSVVAADLNGDGSPDLVVGNRYHGTVVVLLNTAAPVNQPPVLGLVADQMVNEGSPLTFPVTATDPDEGDTLTYSLVSGPAGAGIDAATGVFTWTPDDGPATVTVTVRVADSAGLSDTRSFTITVLNVAPTAGVTGPSSGTIGQTLSFTFTATDPSPADQAAGFTYTIDWGDGTPLQTIAAFPGSGSGVTAGHAYAVAGSYTVRVTAIDKDGGAGSAEFSLVIAPVPTGVSDLSWSGGGILAPPPVAAGEAFTIGRTFAVGGEAVGPFTIAYWASVDDIFGNEDDFLVGLEFFEGAAPGIHSGTSPAFTIGTPGTYFLFAVLDSDGQINEIDETNNLVMALATLLVTGSGTGGEIGNE